MHPFFKKDGHISANILYSMEYKLKIKRQVRGIEGSLYLCLPKYWTDEAGLKKNEPVTIEFLSNKELLIKIGEKHD